MERTYINEFHKQWIEATLQSIESWKKQPISLEEKKRQQEMLNPAGNVESTEGYKGRQIERLKEFAAIHNLWIDFNALSLV